jgi:hypothetical protein
MDVEKIGTDPSTSTGVVYANDWHDAANIDDINSNTTNTDLRTSRYPPEHSIEGTDQTIGKDRKHHYE